MIMESLTPLTEKLPSGSEGGLIFERLMHQLLLEEAKRERVRYEPTSGPGGDRYGVDARVMEGNLLGIEGPFGIEFKWLWDRIDRKKKAEQIENKLRSALREFPKMKTWVLVTPLDFTQAEEKWFKKLPDKYPREKEPYIVVHWGKTEIDNLFYNSHLFLARFYPEALPTDTNYDISDFNTFLNEYRNTLITEYETLRLIGIPTKSYEARDQQMPVPLRKIFIPQNFGELEESEDRDIDLFDILEDENNAKIILGNPGSGKTTLLTFLTLLFSGGADLKGYEKDKDLVPIVVPIREFVRAKSSNFIDFFVQKAKALGLRKAHPFFFEYLLRMREAVVLFDGLDEVGKETERANIARDIKRFYRLYPDSQIWVTSRVVDYSGDVRLPTDQFKHYRIAPLDKPQIETFVKNWYEIQVPRNERERVRRIDSMIAAINRYPRVQRLAANPLLLTLMALIHQHETQLPRDRGALYDKCIEMLIFRWQQRKDEELNQPNVLLDELNIPEDTVRRYLAELAFWVQTENENIKDEEARGLVNERKLLDFLTKIRTDPERGRDKEFARQEMNKFIDYIRDRAGLLIEKGTGQFAFVHLSFLEYLAAQAKQIEEGITDDDRIEFILEHLDKPSWREIILLLLYLIGSGSEQFLDKFTKKAFSYIEKHETDEGWETLGRMLSDNLSLKHTDADKILNELIRKWSKDPRRSGRWYDILNDIALFADRYKDRLKSIIDNQWKKEAETKAIPALILKDTLFGWEPKIPDDLSANEHFKEFAYKLLPFFERENMGNLLKNNTTLTDWFNYRCEIGERCDTYLPLFTHSLENNNELQLEAELAWTWREILTYLSKFSRQYECLDKKDTFIRNTLVLKFSTPGLELSYPIYSPPLSNINSITPYKVHSNPRIDITEAYTGEKDPEAIYRIRRSWNKDFFLNALSSCFEYIVSNIYRDSQFMDPRFRDRFMDPRFRDRFMGQFMDPRFMDRFMDPRFMGQFIEEFTDQFMNRFMDQIIEKFTDQFMEEFMGRFMNRFMDRFMEKHKRGGEKMYERWRDEWKGSRDALFHRKSSAGIHFVIKSSSKGLDTHTTFPPISITNPFLIPYTYYLIWASGISRILVYLSPQLKSESIKRLFKKHRFPYYRPLLEKFSLSLCWDSISFYYQEQQKFKLSGLKDSLFLSQAALVSQIAGFIPKGPHWNSFVTNIEDEDMRLKVSKVLYEIIEQPEKIASLRSKFRKLVGNMKEQNQELLLCAGLINEKGNCTI